VYVRVGKSWAVDSWWSSRAYAEDRCYELRRLGVRAKVEGETESSSVKPMQYSVARVLELGG
jgi:hypothetical protein